MKGTALATLSLALLPVLLPPAQAQESVQLAQAVSAGTIQAVSGAGNTLYLSNQDILEKSLTVGQATTINGRSIPAGAVLRGQFEPVTGGVRYVTRSVEVGGQIYPLAAASGVLHDVKDPREASSGAILGDAAIGAAGGALISEILGDMNLGSVVGGAAAGAIIGNVTAQRVVVIEPNQTITLQVQ